MNDDDIFDDFINSTGESKQPLAGKKQQRVQTTRKQNVNQRTTERQPQKHSVQPSQKRKTSAQNRSVYAPIHTSMPSQRKTRSTADVNTSRNKKISIPPETKARERRIDSIHGKRFMDIIDALIIWTLNHLSVLLLVSVLIIIIGLFVNRYISFGCAFAIALIGILADKRLPEYDPFIFFGASAISVFVIPYLF